MKQKIWLFWIVLMSTGSLQAADVTFKASAPGAVVAGQQFRLSYTLNNASGKDLRVPEITDFDVVYGPSVSKGSSMQIIGTQVESTSYETYTYVLNAKKEGTFEIGPATIMAGNSPYKSNALTIKVIAPDQAGSVRQGGGGDASPSQQQPASPSQINADDVFMRASVSKNSVYENEGFLVTIKLYSRLEITSSLPPTLPNYAGFINYDIPIPAEGYIRSMENYNGKVYTTWVISQSYLYPQKTGKITIEGGKMEVDLLIGRRPRSFFDNGDYYKVKKTLSINPVAINVKPLPPGKPASFAGAVGDYKLTSSINTENLKTNEAVTVKVKITGSGNLKMLKNPEITYPNDFEIYDPKVDLNTKTTAGGVSGSKSIEYLAIPRYAGDFTIPAVEFSYFDPKSASYKKYTVPEYKLHVEKGKGGDASSAVVNYSNKEDIKYLGKDIRYINTESTAVKPGEDFFFGKTAYLLSYLIPSLLFIVFFFVYRKQIRENANLALVRTRKANKIANKRLKVAGKLLKENNREAFYDEVLRALWGYLSDKLSIPVASLTKNNVEIELSGYGVDDALIKDLMDILNTCEFARYAPAQGSGEMDKLYKSTIQAMNRMENTIKK
jgi:hypothetical protein